MLSQSWQTGAGGESGVEERASADTAVMTASAHGFVPIPEDGSLSVAGLEDICGLAILPQRFSFFLTDFEF